MKKNMNEIYRLQNERGQKLLTTKQLIAIQTLRSKLRLDPNTYQQMLSGYAVSSSKELSTGQAGHLITALSASLGGYRVRQNAPFKKYYGTGKRGVVRHITQLQADRIDLLSEFLEWSKVSVLTFILRQTKKVKAVQMLTNTEASKVIVGMQRVFAGQVTSASLTSTPLTSTPLSHRDISSKRERAQEIYNKINTADNATLKSIYEEVKKHGS